MLRCLSVFLLAFSFAQSFSISFIENDAPLPFEGRAHMATAVVGTKIYFFGGILEDYFGTNNSYSYDTTTDTWSQLAEYVRPFYGGCAATDGNDTIWVFGGYDGGYEGPEVRGTYSISTNTWDFGEIPAYSYKCSALYVPQTKQVLVVYGYDATNWMYDPVTDTYNTSYTNLPNPGNTFAAGAVFYQDSVWLAGAGRDLQAFRSVSTDLSTWTNRTSNANGTAYMDLIQIDNVMITFGGIEGDDELSESVARINLYNITSEEWRTLDIELPMALGGATAQLVGAHIYLFGGVYHNETGYAFFNAKSWIVPCVNPAACDYGCDVETKQCISPPVAEPVVPTSSPISAPKSATSNAVVKASFGGLVLAGICIALLA